MKTFFALLLVAIVPGCGNRCDHPDGVTFSCKLVDAGVGGCQGNPATPSAPGTQVFPLGCKAELPECLVAHPDSVKTCVCQKSTATSSPQWECPL